MQNPDDGRRLDRRKKGHGLGLRLQCQQSHLAHAPVIHLLKNEMMLGSGVIGLSWCPGAMLSAPPDPKVAAEGSAATSLQAPHAVGRGG